MAGLNADYDVNDDNDRIAKCGVPRDEARRAKKMVGQR